MIRTLHRSATQLLHSDSGPTLPYHTEPTRWTHDGDRCTLRTVGRGQEFVMDVPNTRLLIDWLQSLLSPKADALVVA